MFSESCISVGKYVLSYLPQLGIYLVRHFVQIVRQLGLPVRQQGLQVRHCKEGNI